MADPPILSMTELLAQREWVRALAGRLVGDENGAADVEQEAWLAALQTRVRGNSPRAWLATVLRRSAGRMARTVSRRGRREAVAAARREAGESPLDTIVRAEAHERVVRAVMSLDPPYRETLLLRFFDNLPPREVARRMDVPVETARARVRRGLEQVRANLDRKYGGDGSKWREALVPLVLPRRTDSVPTGADSAGAASGANTALVAGGLIVSSALIAAWWLGVRQGRDEVAAARADAESLRAESRAQSERATSLETRLARSTARERGLERRALDTAESPRDPATAATPEAAADVGVAPAQVPQRPRFEFEQFAALGSVDWTGLARMVAQVLPTAADFARAVERSDARTAMRSFEKMQAADAPIMAITEGIDGRLGAGQRDVFTHPAFLANVVAATLDAMELPLADGQAAALARIAHTFVEEDERRLAVYSDSTFRIRREIDEADLCRRFAEAAREILSEPQRQALWCDAVRDHGVLDLLSDGAFLSTVCRPVGWRSQDDLVVKMTAAVVKELRLPDARRDAVRAVVASWAETLPASLLDAKFEGTGLTGARSSAMRDGMRVTLALYERLVIELALDPDAARVVRESPIGFVPLAVVSGH